MELNTPLQSEQSFDRVKTIKLKSKINDMICFQVIALLVFNQILVFLGILVVFCYYLYQQIFCKITRGYLLHKKYYNDFV